MTGPAAGAIDERVVVNRVELFTRKVGVGPDVLVLHVPHVENPQAFVAALDEFLPNDR